MEAESAPANQEWPNEEHTVEQLAQSRARIEKELSKVIVGQKGPIEEILIALLAGGHCLITGAPGLAKTLLIKTLSEALDLTSCQLILLERRYCRRQMKGDT